MLISLLYMVFGALMLYLGANWMVKSGTRIAASLGISPIAVGLTVIAFGTSLPELMVSLSAALSDATTIAIGNVVGSNVANVGLVLALSSLIFPMTVIYQTIKRDLLIYLGVCLIFIGFAADGMIVRWEGLILFSGILAYTWFCIRDPSRKLDVKLDERTPARHYLFLLAAGIAGLYVGSDLFVEGAIAMARILGVEEIVLGMSIVALGTSLPELATSVVAAFHRKHAISIGNIIGSNLFNLLSVIGIVALIKPLESPIEIMNLEIPFMVGFALILFPIAWMRQPISRVFSLGLLSGYCIFIILLFI